MAENPVHFPDFPLTGFRSRTPGPPPFTSMNSTPAASRAARIAVRLFGIGSLRPASKFLTVDSPTLAAFASSSCVQFTSPRAARQTADDIGSMRERYPQNEIG